MVNPLSASLSSLCYNYFDEKAKACVTLNKDYVSTATFINNYKKNKLPKAIFAAITKHNKNFKLKDLLKELKKEYKAVNK